MAAPQLDVDVLAIACEFLTDVSDVLAFALTCSSLRPVATRYLLSMHPVPLAGGESVRRFHAFLFADAPARTPHARALDIRLRGHQDATAGEKSSDASRFLDILTSCPNIQDVFLTLYRNLTLDGHSLDDVRVICGIAALQSLRSLTVSGLTLDTLALLRTIRSPLRILNIQCAQLEHGLWVPDQATMDPVALEDFLPDLVDVTVPTLQKLELSAFAVDPDVTDVEFPPTQYPSVRSLSVRSFVGRPLLDHLQHLFPALDGRLCLGRLDSTVREDMYADVRAANERAQEDGSPSLPWTKLDAVVCHAHMFYVLGLRCPIRLAMLNYVADHELRYVAAALRANPVPRLKLTLGLPGVRAAASAGLFAPALAERLTHLTLCLLYSNDYTARNPDGLFPRSRWLDVRTKLLTALRPLHKLTHLRVVAHASVYVHEDAPSPVAPPQDYAYTLRDSQSAFDFRGTAAALARALPALRYVFLAAGGYVAAWSRGEGACDDSEVGRWRADERWDAARGWRVAEAEAEDGMEGGRTLVELHPDVAETIIGNEELVLSEADEEALRVDGD